MKYISGFMAFTQHADDNEMSCGVWNFSPDIFDDIESYMRESEDYPYRDAGIFDTMLNVVENSEVYKCANHARAYCDLLMEHDFKTLAGFFDMNIRDGGTKYSIFGMCKNYGLFEDKEIMKFMVEEFGSNIRSYLLLYGDDNSLKDALQVTV